jgi:hypothetical protein
MLRHRSRYLAVLALALTIGSKAATSSDIQPPTASIPATYFGMHMHHLDKETPWPNVPIPEWRIWDAHVTWPDLEPHKGDWHFAKLDSYINMAQQHGTGVLLTLGQSPAWASARPPEPTAEPANMDDWRNYVKTVVERYKGRIQAYEVWNEPNLPPFWSGTTDQMIALTKEASQIIHSVDPAALVVSPSATATYGTPWLEEFLKKGAAQYVDVIGYHFYVTPKPPEDLIPFIQKVRQIMTANGAGRKPLWNTETGWLEPSHFDSDEAAAGVLARSYILAWAAGVERYYWYAWDNRKVALKTTREDNSTSTSAGQAFAVIQQWLVGAAIVSCSQSPDQTWTCQLNRGGKKEWVVWNPAGEIKFTPPASWNVKSAAPLMQKVAPSGPNMNIGPVPVLYSGGS